MNGATTEAGSHSIERGRTSTRTITSTSTSRIEAVRGTVFDVQRMSIHDGPGIRTTVFLKGCPLRCIWCHNPEGASSRPQLAFTSALCIGCGFCLRRCPNAAHVMSDERHDLVRERCTECFGCVEECYSKALEVIGKDMSVAEVITEVAKDQLFYDESGGGMTVSGGEPLMQFDFTLELLVAARARGIHTCLETCGLAEPGRLEQLAPLVDLFLFDYKETDPERHQAYTGHSNERVLDNLRLLDGLGAAIVLRCPIVPGLNLREDHLEGIARLARSLAHSQGVHVMGYHALGGAKRARLGQPGALDLPSMTRDETEAVVVRLRELGAANVAAG